jgi:hypothetical protein
VPGEDAGAAAPTPRSTVTVQNVDLVESGSSAVYGPDDRQIGTVEQIFGGSDSRAPEWLTVATSRVKDGGVLVPLTGARLHAGDVIIAYTDDQLRDAPTIVADDDLTPSDAARASAHYAQADKDPAAD